MSNHDKIENSFVYHRPFGTQPERYEALRAKAKEFAHFIDTSVVDSREKSVALTKLEEVVMWANKGIACNESEHGGTATSKAA